MSFKNSTNGNIDHAIDAIHASRRPQSLIQCNCEGCHVVIHSPGNQYGHLILRGGDSPNYTKPHIQAGDDKIVGIMCVSFLQGGQQSSDQKPLNYGQSITDECLGWQDSVDLLRILHRACLEKNKRHQPTIA
ncbi:hypothetical protein [Vibrio profundi]|uniref:hypothetical protein n=1 Tax=Vibrio profundi TaxID=1774960 RepID=UPI0037363C41